MNNAYVIDYLNENDFRKKERAIKKYNMLAYKKLVFEIYPALREGKFYGNKSNLEGESITKYELILPTDSIFVKVHGEITLHYTVYEDKKTVMLDTLSPEDVLQSEGYHQKELTTYKGVMVSKSNAEKDMFKINLLDMLKK